jgi:hypothetical protein
MSGTAALYSGIVALIIVFAIATILVYRWGWHSKWMDRRD